jgi:hypothetical protein
MHWIAVPAEVIQLCPLAHLDIGYCSMEHQSIEVVTRRWKMLTAGEIEVQIGRGELVWPGELRGDGLLLRLGSPLQPLFPGGLIDLADQDSIDALYEQPVHGWDDFELAPWRMALCVVEQPLRLGLPSPLPSGHCRTWPVSGWRHMSPARG